MISNIGPTKAQIVPFSVDSQHLWEDVQHAYYIHLHAYNQYMNGNAIK